MAWYQSCTKAGRCSQVVRLVCVLCSRHLGQSLRKLAWNVLQISMLSLPQNDSASLPWWSFMEYVCWSSKRVGKVMNKPSTTLTLTTDLNCVVKSSAPGCRVEFLSGQSRSRQKIITRAPEVRLTCRLVHSAYVFKTKRSTILLSLIFIAKTDIEQISFSEPDPFFSKIIMSLNRDSMR